MSMLVPTRAPAVVETARALMVVAEQSPTFVGRFDELDQLLEALLPNTDRRDRAIALRDIAQQIVAQRTVEQVTLAQVQARFELEAADAFKWQRDIQANAIGYAYEAEARALTAALTDREARS